MCRERLRVDQRISPCWSIDIARCGPDYPKEIKLRSNLRIVWCGASGMSIALLAIFAPLAMVAQQTPGSGYRSPISLTTSSVAPLRLGVSGRNSNRGERVVSLTTTLRTHGSAHNDPAGLDTAASRRVRQRLTHTAIGAVSGAAVGTAIGALAAASPPGQNCHDLCSNRGIGVAYLGGVGLLTGAVVGAVWPTH